MENIMINENNKKNIETFGELTYLSDYSFIENLNSDPDAKHNGDNKYQERFLVDIMFL